MNLSFDTTHKTMLKGTHIHGKKLDEYVKLSESRNKLEKQLNINMEKCKGDDINYMRENWYNKYLDKINFYDYKINKLISHFPNKCAHFNPHLSTNEQKHIYSAKLLHLLGGKNSEYIELHDSRFLKNYHHKINNREFCNFYDKYLKCEFCGSRKMKYEKNEIYTCNECFSKNEFFNEGNKNENSCEYKKNNNNYKQIKRANDILDILMGYNTPNLLAEEIDNILDRLSAELKKIKIINVTPLTILDMLNKLNLPTLYKYNVYFYCKLYNKNHPKFSNKQKTEILYYFSKAIDVWEVIKPPDKSSCYSYKFIFYKIFELLGYKYLASYIDISKTKSKLKEFDEYWKETCNKYGWLFIYTKVLRS